MQNLDFSRFGKTITLNVQSFTDAATLPAESAAYIWTYGMKQSLADSFAAAKDAPEFEALLNKRWDAIKAGTVGIRSRVGDPVKAMELKVAAETFNQKPIEKRRKAIAAYVLKVHGVEKASDKQEAEAIAYIVGQLAETETVKAEAAVRLESKKAVAESVDLESLLDGLDDETESDEDETVDEEPAAE